MKYIIRLEFSNVFYLEIWIRKGKDNYGNLKLKESLNGKIRYENSILIYSSNKYTYHCHVSLEFEEYKSTWSKSISESRWTFVARCNVGVAHKYLLERPMNGKYNIGYYHYVTSGRQILVRYMVQVARTF